MILSFHWESSESKFAKSTLFEFNIDERSNSTPKIRNILIDDRTFAFHYHKYRTGTRQYRCREIFAEPSSPNRSSRSDQTMLSNIAVPTSYIELQFNFETRSVQVSSIIYREFTIPRRPMYPLQQWEFRKSKVRILI